MLAERLVSRKIVQAFAEILPGLAAQLRRHGGALARVARIGTDVAEFLAMAVRRPLINRQAEAEFWHQVGQRDQDLRDHLERQKQTRRHGR